MKIFKLTSLTLAALTLAFPFSHVAQAYTYLEKHHQTNETKQSHSFSLEGEAGENPTFLTQPQFITSLDNGHLNINGYQIQQDDTNDIEYKKVYDQEIRATSNHTAISVRFSINNQSLSLESMKDAYPNERLNHIPHTSNDSQYPEDGIYVYHGKMIKLQYKVTHGFVTSVTIGEGVDE